VLCAKRGHFDCWAGVDEGELVSASVSHEPRSAAVGERTDLNLVANDLDAALDNALHVLCVKVAQTQPFHARICLEILQRFDILVVVVLPIISPGPGWRRLVRTNCQ
jgi:hypothetical protein